MPHPKVKIADNSGNEVSVTDNALHVNVAGATMSTGDIEVNSEFPAAATITDNFANPSTTSVMSMGMAWDGATWDRLLGNSTDGLLVNLGSNNDVAATGTVTANAGTGTLAVSLASVPSHAVTNTGTFEVQVSDTSFAIADGNALGEGVLVQGDDGSDRKNIHVDATTGDVQVDVTNTVTVDLGSNNDVTVTNDTAGNLLATVTQDSAARTVTGTVGHDITGIVSDRDVDVGTTAEKIHTASDVAIKRIDIQAHPDNTGYIFVGDSGVAGNGSGGGIRLAAGDFYSLDIDNTGDVYVASSVADENVSYIYYT